MHSKISPSLHHSRVNWQMLVVTLTLIFCDAVVAASVFADKS